MVINAVSIIKMSELYIEATRPYFREGPQGFLYWDSERQTLRNYKDTAET